MPGPPNYLGLRGVVGDPPIIYCGVLFDNGVTTEKQQHQKQAENKLQLLSNSCSLKNVVISQLLRLRTA